MKSRRVMTKELKERLRTDGLWGKWCRRRDELKESGVDPREAASQALDEFGVDAGGPSGVQPFDVPSDKPVSKKTKTHPAARLLKQAEGLECGEVESVRWAADHALIDWSEIDRAPSRSAVTLLEWAKTDFREFMRVTWSKLLSGKESSGPSDWMEAVSSLGSTIGQVIKAREDARLESV